MLSKSKNPSGDAPSDLQLIQQHDDLDSLLDSSMIAANKAAFEDKHDTDMGAVDDLMKKYDNQEKTSQQNEDFVKVLKKDEKLLNFFIENYQPGADPSDDEKYISYEFSKFSEQGWSDDGKPMDKQVLSKKNAKKFASEIVQKWKGFDLLDDNKLTQKKTEKYLDSNKKFEKAWKKMDTSKDGSGSIDMMEAHEFVKNIIPRADNVQSVLVAQMDKEGLI